MSSKKLCRNKQRLRQWVCFYLFLFGLFILNFYCCTLYLFGFLSVILFLLLNFILFIFRSADGTVSGLLSGCNADCTCKNEWNPVCDTETGNTYYSACFAGCRTKISDVTGDKWTDCSCVDISRDTSNTASVFLSTISPRSDTIVSGFCTKECGWKMWIFLVLLFFSVVASFASGIPSQQAS